MKKTWRIAITDEGGSHYEFDVDADCVDKSSTGNWVTFYNLDDGKRVIVSRFKASMVAFFSEETCLRDVE
jgi:hypothetical protein